MKRSEVLNKQYEIIRYLCFQLIHFQSDFENEFLIKGENDKEIFEAIKELFKTLQNDAFTTADLINEILNAEEDNSISKEVN